MIELGRSGYIKFDLEHEAYESELRLREISDSLTANDGRGKLLRYHRVALENALAMVPLADIRR